MSQSQDCTAAALACSKILKELSKEEEDTDSSEEMLALADEFEHRAIGELPGSPPLYVSSDAALVHELDVLGQHRRVSLTRCPGYHLKGQV